MTRESLPRKVFFTCWVVYAFFWAPYIVREHYPALALEERGSLNVERYLGWTDDIFRGPHGGAFINNNPGASLTGAIPLLLFRPALRRLDEWNQSLPRPARQGGDDDVFRRTIDEGRAFYFLAAGFLTAALVMAPATAAVVAFLCSRMIDAGVPAHSAAIAATLCGLATPLLFRVGHLNHNLLVADAGFAALVLLWDPGDKALTQARAFIAGLLCGYALLCDYSGIVVILIAGSYVLLRNWRSSAGFLAGLVPGVAVLLIYQAWAFGSFYHPSQQYMTPTAPTAYGYRGFDWPSPTLAWALMVDPRFGLLAYSPALALAFASPFVGRLKYSLGRREMWILLAYFALFTIFCAANRYSWLQPLTGFRYLIPVVPGLALLALQTAQALPRMARILLAAAACTQTILMAAAHANDVRLTLPELWQRRFTPLWMSRLYSAGMPAVWVQALGLLALFATVLVLVRFAAALRVNSRLE